MKRVFHVLTLFPGMFASVLGESILRRAQERGLVEIHLHHLRDYASGKHRITDDYPYGGGAGMVLKPEPFFRAVDALGVPREALHIVLLSPQGSLLTQPLVQRLAALEKPLVLLCGRYEGVDERVREGLAHEEISIGDYVLTGGELPAMVLIDAVARLIPGVLGDEASAQHDSFSDGILDHPHYTRPRVYRNMRVPEVLLSGHHEAIRRWRRRQALLKTLRQRPDLLEKAALSEEDRRLLEES